MNKFKMMNHLGFRRKIKDGRSAWRVLFYKLNNFLHKVTPPAVWRHHLILGVLKLSDCVEWISDQGGENARERTVACAAPFADAQGGLSAGVPWVPPTRTSHLCSDRMYVCADYKLIVHGGLRGENPIRERDRDYRLLNVGDYTFSPLLLISAHANESVDYRGKGAE